MKLYLKKKPSLTNTQEEVTERILAYFGIDNALVIEYSENSETGKSTCVVPCVKTGETLQFTLDRPQSQNEIATLIPHELLRLLLSNQEGAFVDKENVNSVDCLFDVTRITRD